MTITLRKLTYLIKDISGECFKKLSIDDTHEGYTITNKFETVNFGYVLLEDAPFVLRC